MSNIRTTLQKRIEEFRKTSLGQDLVELRSLYEPLESYTHRKAFSRLERRIMYFYETARSFASLVDDLGLEQLADNEVSE